MQQRLKKLKNLIIMIFFLSLSDYNHFFRFIFCFFMSCCLLSVACENKSFNVKRKFFDEHDKKISIKSVSLKEYDFNKDNVVYEGYIINILPWDINLSKASGNVTSIMNGYIFCTDDSLMYVDSIKNERSLLLKFGKHKFTGNILLSKCISNDSSIHCRSDTFSTSIIKVFYSRLYEEEIYQLKIMKIGIYYINDNLCLFVGKKNGILGMYIDIPNDIGEKDFEVVLSYVGDIFPYNYDCNKIMFMNKLFRD